MLDFMLLNKRRPDLMSHATFYDATREACPEEAKCLPLYPSQGSNFVDPESACTVCQFSDARNVRRHDGSQCTFERTRRASVVLDKPPGLGNSCLVAITRQPLVHAWPHTPGPSGRAEMPCLQDGSGVIRPGGLHPSDPSSKADRDGCTPREGRTTIVRRLPGASMKWVVME